MISNLNEFGGYTNLQGVPTEQEEVVEVVHLVES